MFYKRLCLFLMFLFCTQFAQGQLSNFTLSATKIDETCTANGSLSFSVSNTTPGSVILYSIYLLPNVTTPYSVQSSTTISGLTSGTYRIVATQSYRKSKWFTTARYYDCRFCSSFIVSNKCN